YAPAIAELDPLRERVSEFVYRNRAEFLKQQVTDRSAQSVDEAMRIPVGERRSDLYRPQRSIPAVHPDGYFGPGLNRYDVPLREGYSPNRSYPATPYAPADNPEGRPFVPEGGGFTPLKEFEPMSGSEGKLLPSYAA